MGDRINKAGEKWGDIRKRLREAAHNQCAFCGDYCNPVLLDIDHIKPLSCGGSDEDDNLRVLCRPCHVKRHKIDHEVTLEERLRIRREHRRAMAQKYQKLSRATKKKVPKDAFHRKYEPYRFNLGDAIQSALGGLTDETESQIHPPVFQ